MNFLAHAYLAGDSDAFLAGNLMGDFVRGQPDPSLPATVRTGIELHRRIDAFTDRHPRVRDARRRFSPPQRRAAGIIIDLVFDHFLARDWHRYHPEPLPAFTAATYAALARHHHLLPPRLTQLLPAMRRDDWLASYADLGVTADALHHMATRLSRHPEMLRGLHPELERLHDRLERDFEAFFPDVIAFAGETAGPPS